MNLIRYITSHGYMSKVNYCIPLIHRQRTALTGTMPVLLTRLLCTKETTQPNVTSEISKAKLAATSNSNNKPTIFDKILDGSIPAEIIHDDKQCIAFTDVNPQAPIHFLVIPKQRISQLQDAKFDDKELLGHLLVVSANLAKVRLPNGFRIVINNGEHGCQSVYHLHIHVIGGRQLSWPPG